MRAIIPVQLTLRLYALAVDALLRAKLNWLTTDARL